MSDHHDEVRRVKASREQELLALPNVTGVFTGTKTTGGVDTGEVAIVVTVAKKQDVAPSEAVPANLDGVTTDVIEERIVPMQLGTAVRLEDLAPAIDTTNYATLAGGMSIGPCRSFHLVPPEVPEEGDYVFTGTLGCIVTDNASGDHMMLSNFHVMCVDSTWAVGDFMAQPSRVDGGSCPDDRVGALSRAQLNASVDAAVSSISGRPSSCEIIDIGDVAGTAAAVVDMAVRKRGRTTELTHGTITATDYTTTIDYGDGLGTVTLTNQIRIVNDSAQSAFFGKKGDSGSVVVDADRNVVGLYFAGNTTGTVGVANHIAAVTAALDVTVCAPVIKKFEKETWKETFPDKLLVKESKLELKELGEGKGLKDLIKEWKEYAYEKFAAFEWDDPWQGRFDPWDGGRPPVVDGPVARPPVQGFRSAPNGAGASIEERLLRLEAALAQQGQQGQQGQGAPHFIGGALRPDLGRGALGREAGGKARTPLHRQG